MAESLINEEKDNFRLSPSALSASPADQALDIDSCERALNNSVVLRTIMSHLRFRELLVTRLFSKHWEEEATIQLLARCRKTQQTGYYDEVKFYWKDDHREFRNKVGSLQDFIDRCCSFSDPLQKFPCSQFSFTFETKIATVEEATADLIKFFSKNGGCVTRLRLKSSRNSASAFELLRKIIFEWAPNLKFLDLDVNLYQDEIEPPTSANIVTAVSKSSSSSSSSDNLPKFVLNQLKEFTGYSGYDSRRPESGLADPTAVERFALLFKEILSSAPNLTNISDPGLRFTKEIVATGKIPAISGYECSTFDESMVPRLYEFSRARPQLTFLQLFGAEDDGEITESSPLQNFLPSLELIFQSSQKTLKNLSLSGRLDGPDHESGRSILIPIMENLETFYAYNWNVAVGGGQGRILPPGYNVQDLFPRLKKLMLGGLKEEDEEDNPFNKGCNSSTTVNSLYIDSLVEPDSFFNLGWLSQALVLYPNVRSLDLMVRYWKEVPEICRTVWEAWKKSWLEELSITCYSSDNDHDDDGHHNNANDNANLAENMDQVLTGFDPELCKVMRSKQGSEHWQEEEAEEGGLKRGPSILDMKRLKLFKLGHAEDFPFFSRVAVIHAFEPMRRRQDLKVLIDDVELDKITAEYDDDH